MESFKNWAVSLIAASLIGSIYSFLMPSKSFQSVLKLGLTAFLMSVLILPLISSFNYNEFKREIPSVNNSALENDYINETIITQACESVKKEIKELLKQKKFTFKDVLITMNIENNAGIVINEVEVSGVPDSQKQSLHDYLKKEAGLEVTVKE